MQDCHSAVAADVGLLGCESWCRVTGRVAPDMPKDCSVFIFVVYWGKNCLTLRTKAPRTFETSETAHLVTQWHLVTQRLVSQRHLVTQRHVSHPSGLESPAAAPLSGPHISRFAWCECGTICTSCVSVCPQERLRCPCCLSCLLAFLANPCLSCLLAALPNLLTSTCLPAPTKEVSQI